MLGVDNERLKIWFSGANMSELITFSSLGPTLSAPGDLLFLKFIIILYISPGSRSPTASVPTSGAADGPSCTYVSYFCERSGLLRVVGRNWCYFRFLLGRKWITRQSFLNSFSSASRSWTRKTSFYRGGIG